MSKVWFITGTSKGFGRIWAEAALERGDRVVATARNADTLDPLVEAYGDLVLPLALDVTDKAAIDAAVAAGPRALRPPRRRRQQRRLRPVRRRSRRSPRQQARAQMETNLFGALWVTQAVLPILREQGSGHIIQVSSIGGVNAFPILGLYHASKWGARRLQPVAGAPRSRGFGIKVTLVEPTGFSTDWSRPVLRAVPSTTPAYDGVREQRAELLKQRLGTPGRPGGHRPRDPRARRRRRAAAARCSSAPACST